eukprot:m.47947 g.47947  ORF g.47947 m.47947 type:complete len:67 (-) comp6942_c0_seq2:2-202(-)
MGNCLLPSSVVLMREYTSNANTNHGDLMAVQIVHTSTGRYQWSCLSACTITAVAVWIAAWSTGAKG